MMPVARHGEKSLTFFHSQRRFITHISSPDSLKMNALTEISVMMVNRW